MAGNRSGSFASVNALIPLTSKYTATQAQFINNAITYVWDGSAGDGLWFTAANWTPSGGPGSTDYAILNINQTINLTSSTLVGYFQQADGTFTSPANAILTVLHDLNWTGGTMGGSGVTNANGGLQMNTQASHVLDGRTLNLPAGQTATMSGGAYLQMQNGARINNAGTFLAQQGGSPISSTSIQSGGGAASLFNNTGTFTRDTTTGTFATNVPFANSGTVNVATGTLTFRGGDNGATTGDFNIVDGSQVDFDGGSFTLGLTADVAGAGRVIVSGGTVVVGGSFAMRKLTVSGGTATFNVPTSGMEELIVSNGNFTGTTPLDLTNLTALTVSGGTANFNATAPLNLTTLTMSGGTLNTASTINIANLLNWTGGTMVGSGVTNANGGLQMNTQASHVLDGWTLNLPAGQTATMSGGAYLQMQNGARINNAGTFLAQQGGSPISSTSIQSGGGAASLFNNTGTFIRDTTTGTFATNVPFANSGTVNVATGTLALSGGDNGTTAGEFNIADGSQVDFDGGSFTLGPTADVAGAGRVIVSGGTVVVGGSFAMRKVTVSGGTETFNVPTSGWRN